jgi:hypothetical protein
MVHDIVLCRSALETPGHARATLEFVLSCLSSATLLQGLFVTRGGRQQVPQYFQRLTLRAVRTDSKSGFEISFFVESERTMNDLRFLVTHEKQRWPLKLEIEIRASGKLTKVPSEA